MGFPGKTMPVKREQWIPAHGEQHLCAKLTFKDVLEIKVRRQSGMSLRKIAREFGVSSGQVCRILTGKRWKRSLMENASA